MSRKFSTSLYNIQVSNYTNERRKTMVNSNFINNLNSNFNTINTINALNRINTLNSINQISNPKKKFNFGIK